MQHYLSATDFLAGVMSAYVLCATRIAGALHVSRTGMALVSRSVGRLKVSAAE